MLIQIIPYYRIKINESCKNKFGWCIFDWQLVEAQIKAEVRSHLF